MNKIDDFIAIIPARGGSKGLRNKNVLKINNLPLIVYTIKAAMASQKISEVYVSTDSDKIAKIAKENDVEVIKRPKRLSTDNAKQDHVVRHAINYINAKKSKKIKNIVLLQATAPLREKNDIDKCINLYEKSEVDCVFSSVHIDICLWRKKGSKLMPVNFQIEKRGNRQNAQIDLIENGSIYVSKAKSYFTKKMRFGISSSSYVMKNFSVFEIDNKEEFNLIEMMIKSNDKIFKNIIR